MEQKQHKFLALLPRRLPAIEASVAAQLKKDLAASSISQLERNLRQVDLDKANESLCIEFALSVRWVLNEAERTGKGDLSVQQKLLELGESALIRCGIPPRTSNLSYLHADLHRGMAERLFDHGQHWDALWSLEYADFIGKSTVAPPDKILLQAKLLVLTGATHQAEEVLARLTASDAAPRIKAEAVHWQIQIAWLSGDIGLQMTLLDFGEREYGSDPQVLKLLRWERQLIGCLSKDDFMSLSGALRRETDSVPFRVSAAHYLYAMGHRSKRWRQRFDERPAEFSRVFNPDEQALYDLLMIIRDLHQADVPHDRKIPLVRDAAHLVERVSDMVCRLLALAALSRWLKSNRQSLMCSFYLAKFHASLPRGVGDFLGLTSDLQGDADTVTEEKSAPAAVIEAKASPAPIFSNVNALLDLAWTSTKVMLRQSNHSESGEVQTQSLEDLAAFIKRRAKKRRGVFVKVGQYAGFLGGLANRELRQAGDLFEIVHDRLDKSVVDTCVERSLGQPMVRVFDRWDDVPLGVGSIGQVHRASFEGREVAVKVQHPHVKDHIMWDLRLFRTTRALVEKRFPHLDLAAIEAAVTQSLLRETDYRAEADSLLKLARVFSPYQEFKVPGVVAALSSERLLVMDYVEGDSFADFVKRATPAERSAAGLAIFKAAYIGERHGLVNVDVHPNNYLFGTDGKLILIDAGAVHEQNALLTRRRIELLRAVIARDLEAADAHMRRLGFFKDDKLVSQGERMDYWKIAWKPLMDEGGFKFTEAFVNELQERQTKMRLTLPPDQFATIRFEWALFPMLSYLEAEGDFRGIAMEILRSAT